MQHRRREPAPGVFRLLLPLPFPELRRVNAYVLTDADGVTLIDCGIHNPDPDQDHGWTDLIEALAACDVDLKSIGRLVVTHTHIDHYGMAARIVSETGCDLWMHRDSELDLEIYRAPDESARRVAEMLADHGVEGDELKELTAFEDWRPFISGVVEASTSLEGGETFRAAGREWSIVATPGHSRSHICVWSESDGLFFSGDHLLPTITPHIDFVRGGEADPLGDFLVSLEKVEDLDPKLVLPGHGHPFEDGAERARIVARHHDRRLGAILQVIRHEARTATEITDEIFGTTLLHFERRLALGEALAHLVYLRRRGEIEREERDGTYVYKKVRRLRQEEDDE
ncbi:MAG TPA: MBL fold metallo-hydrolase [Actinomycetota bacterium]|nr:MBL fold metallo-hydrolase [Actinomycetota bacterium]